MLILHLSESELLAAGACETAGGEPSPWRTRLARLPGGVLHGPWDALSYLFARQLFGAPDVDWASSAGVLPLPSFGGADLGGADLGGADLGGAYFGGANLGGAHLSCADLSCADLSCANLSDADLSCANLSDADLRCAYLDGANLSGAYLGGAHLSGARRLCSDSPIHGWRLVDGRLQREEVAP